MLRLPSRRRAAGTPALDDDIQPVRTPSGIEPGDDVVLVAQIGVYRVRDEIRSRRPLRHTARARGITNGDQLLRVRHREGAQQKRIDESEDRRVRADPQRQDEQHDGREALLLPERSDRVPGILPEILQTTRARHGSFSLVVDGETFIPHRAHVPELLQRLRASGLGSEPRGHQLARPHLDVECELLVHGAVHVLPPDGEPEGSAPAPPQHQAVRGAVARSA